MDLCLPQTVRLDSRKIKRIREEKGLTQLYVATVVGVTIDTISRWENKRYPSVKRENALKLAQTLEVDVEEILEEPQQPPESSKNEKLEESSEKGDEETLKNSTAGKKKSATSTAVAVAAAVAVLFAISGFLAGYSFFRPSDAPLDISAVRFLPERCAQGSLFPVVVKVDIRPSARRTILLKEDIPRTLRVIKSVPKYTSLGKGLLKWLYQGDTSSLKFVYIARMPLVKENRRLRFRGTVTIRTSRSVNVAIGGNNVVAAAPFHWADQNGDNTIDDEEILDAYQLLSGIKGMAGMLKEVESLWAAGRYQWDKSAKRFVPIENSK